MSRKHFPEERIMRVIDWLMYAACAGIIAVVLGVWLRWPI
jgi:hypothetical protein